MLRAAFHVHSDRSYDGRFSLQSIAHRFAGRGYDAVLLCEHCRTFDETRDRNYREACAEVRGGARLIPGIEYRDPENRVHLPIWGLSEFVGAEVPTALVLDRVRAEAAACVFAHPSRKDAWRVSDPTWSDAPCAFEVWNRKTDGLAPTAHRRLFAESGLRPIVALDDHTERQRFPFSLRIRSESGSSDAGLIETLRSGHRKAHALGVPLEASLNVTGGATPRAAEAAGRIAFRNRLVRSIRARTS